MRKRFFVVAMAGFLAVCTQLLLLPSLSGQEVPRMSARAALQKYNAGKVILIDAMNSRTYKKYHILGAISMPGDGKADLDRIKAAKIPIPKNQEILVYCD